MVKIATGNQADSPEETYEPICESSAPVVLPRANCSFLWSNHEAKTTFPNHKPVTIATREDGEDTDSEGYDDVGPSNFVAQVVQIIMLRNFVSANFNRMEINFFEFTLCE